jgi:hypothetical protein
LAGAFAGHDADAGTYAARLAGLATAQHMQQLHQGWETAYVAASEARLLQEAIAQLSQRSAELAVEHAQQEQLWRAREAEWERQRQYAELRESRIRYKQVDEDRRLVRLKEAATLTVPVAAASAGGVLLGQAGAQVAAELATAIEQAIANAARKC